MAQALKFHAVVSGKTLSLPDLGAFEGKRVEVIVVEEEAPAEIRTTPTGQRPLGLLRGQFVVPDDFDAPLPTEIQQYFEFKSRMPPQYLPREASQTKHAIDLVQYLENKKRDSRSSRRFSTRSKLGGTQGVGARATLIPRPCSGSEPPSPPGAHPVRTTTVAGQPSG